jgi:hypothetical protein
MRFADSDYAGEICYACSGEVVMVVLVKEEREGWWLWTMDPRVTKMAVL